MLFRLILVRRRTAIAGDRRLPAACAPIDYRENLRLRGLVDARATVDAPAAQRSVTRTVALLLAEFGSFVDEATVAVLSTLRGFPFTATSIVIVAVAPLAIVPSAHRRVFAAAS